MKKILLMLLALIVVGCQSFNSHCLFDKGNSQYTIIVDSAASECVRYAAEELRDWVREVSGVTLPIVYDLEAGSKGKRLVVGYNTVTSQRIQGISVPDGCNDSFTYCSRGGDVFFWGDTDRGTLYSVYSFLEREFGCRWYNSRVSVVPKCESWSFTELSHSEVPAIRMRNDYYYDLNTHPEFAARLRSNSTHSIPRAPKFGGSVNYWSCHTLPWFINAAVYFDEHPEYFGIVDGKRSPKAQPCMSNPDVLKITIEETRKAIKNNPDYLIYSVSQGDSYPHCQCEECKAIKAQYGDTESGILLWFINQVADAVKDEFPDKFIGTFAYQETRPFPQNIKPRENMVIRLCPIEECQLHAYDVCEKNRAFLKDLEGWAAIADHLYIWDYTTSFTNYLLPMANVWTFQDRMRHFRDAHAIGVMPQGSYQSVNNAFEDMKAYVLAKLMWNPDCDVDEVIRDFTDGFFGEAAGPIIREYLAYERQSLVRDDNHEDLYPNERSLMYTDDFVPGAKVYFSRAKEAIREAGGDNVEELIARVEYAEVAICCLELMRTPAEGKADGSLDLFKRVIDREGIAIWREWGDRTKIEHLLQIIESE